MALTKARLLKHDFPVHGSSSNLPGGFTLKNAVDFGEIYLVSISHETKHEDSSKNSEQNPGQNSKNSGNFSSATFLT